MLKLDLLTGQEEVVLSRCCCKPVNWLVIISDVGVHGLICSLGFVNEYHQFVFDMHPSCFYLSWGDTMETQNIPSIWVKTSSHDLDLWRVSHTKRDKETTQRHKRDAVSECVLFLKRETDRTEQEKREKNCAHTSQREKECAPTKKAYMLGLLTHLGVATRLVRRVLSIHFAHVWTITKPYLETLNHQSQHSSSLLRICPLETRQDEINTDLLEDNDDADWYALVSASCSRSCLSRRTSWLYTRKPAPLLLWNFVGLLFLFLARNICTTSFSHPILVRRNRHLSQCSVCLSY